MYHCVFLSDGQAGEREVGGVPQGKANHQPSEEDGASHWSSSSKLTRSPVKVTKKPKNMQCKITLLDGSDYTCVVEVRQTDPELVQERIKCFCLFYCT